MNTAQPASLQSLSFFTVKAFFDTPTTIACSSGASCANVQVTCPSQSVDGTSNCYFDIMIMDAQSGWRVQTSISTFAGVTSQYVRLGDFAAPGQSFGPAGTTSNIFACTSADRPVYVRVYCFSNVCRFSVTFTTVWALGECGMVWKADTTSPCSVSCTRPASCFYNNYNISAPSPTACVGALGNAGSVSTCSNSQRCGSGSTSLCINSRCVDLCSNVFCGSFGACQLQGSSAVCKCSSCYTGTQCTFRPSGAHWEAGNWSACDCATGNQSLSIVCASSTGCLLDFDRCTAEATNSPEDFITEQDCDDDSYQTAECGRGSASSTTPFKSDIAIIVYIVGGTVGLLAVCFLVQRRRRRRALDADKTSAEAEKWSSATSASGSAVQMASITAGGTEQSMGHSSAAHIAPSPMRTAGIHAGASVRAQDGELAAVSIDPSYQDRQDRADREYKAQTQYNRDQAIGVAQDFAKTIGVAVRMYSQLGDAHIRMCSRLHILRDPVTTRSDPMHMLDRQFRLLDTITSTQAFQQGKASWVGFKTLQTPLVTGLRACKMPISTICQMEDSEWE